MAGSDEPPPSGGSSNTPHKDDKFLAVPGLTSDTSSTGNSRISEGEETLVHREHADEDPLHPDPGADWEFEVENNPFAFSPGQLGKLLNPKNLAALRALGGINGLERGLRTDRTAGLSSDEARLDGTVSFEEATQSQADSRPGTATRVPTSGTVNKGSQAFADRTRVFKDNRLPHKKPKSLLQLMWIALMDKVLLLLSAAAAISLALGLYRTFGVKHDPDEGPPVDWVEGVAIIVAILIVVIVGAGNDWQKERQFVKLNRKKEDRTVKVIRSGKTIQISVYDMLVGDVCHLEPGDLIAADGIFISGHNVKCDESSATGESDQMKKTPCDETMAQLEASAGAPHKLDPFILSGGKVLEGVGTYLVTGVGIHSSYGKTMMALREDASATPLQMKLNDLAEAIAKLGGAAALLLFIVLFIRFLVQLRGNTNPPDVKGQNFMRILITAITVVVVAIPEGLPLAVTVALAFATVRMLKDNNLVRVLQACETMGNATTICSDKTGTLTQNRMTVITGTMGTSLSFDEKAVSTAGQSPSPPLSFEKEIGYEDATVRKFLNDASSDFKELLLQSIALNSTAFEGEEDGKPAFIGSKTETALLEFARTYLGMGPVAEIRSSAKITQLIPFDSSRKCMGVVVQLPDESYRMFVKGASEIVLKQCTRIADPRSSLKEHKLGPEVATQLADVITQYAERSLRTIGLLYRDFPAGSWPPSGARGTVDDAAMAEFEDIFDDMIWMGLVGIQDPLRDGVNTAVAQCQKAGVFVRMVTGDNVTTAKAIAQECSIYTTGGIVMEGPKFRKLSPTQMDQIIPRLQVLARSSPEDKRILVRRLKELGETVAVTGDGTNDGPALKMADVGFSMGIAGTEVAKEASSIILMDDNFSSIVKALMWGRAVNDAVKKFLQFQLTVNITAVTLTFVSAVASDEEKSVLTAVQLLWVNLIMDFAALALATDPPAPSVLDRKPDPKSASLITVNMWKMIIGQAIYQLVVTFVLNFAGMKILGYKTSDDPKLDQTDDLRSLVFNAFVWMQIFNQYNNRRLDNKFNIFEGVTRNYWFIGINLVMVGGQVMIIFVGGKAFSVVRLNGIQWAISIILGALSVPVAVIIRLIPDELFAKFLPHWMVKRHEAPVYVSNEDRFQWNRGIEEIREELAFLRMVRGGRLNQLRFRQRNIKETMKENFSHLFKGKDGGDDSIHPPPSPTSHKRRRSRSNSAFAAAAMVPSIVAGSIGGWSPVEREGSSRDAFGSKSELEAQGVSVHPKTSNTDPILPEELPKEGSAPSQQPGLTPASQK